MKSRPKKKTREQENVQPLCAALYARSATDEKKQINRQITDIRDYAARHGIKIVESYIDCGKSKVCPSRENMMSVIENKRAEFSVILMHDLSRWGRFQNIDTTARYEYVCLCAGIDVHYVIEESERFWLANSPLKGSFVFKRYVHADRSK